MKDIWNESWMSAEWPKPPLEKFFIPSWGEPPLLSGEFKVLNNADVQLNNLHTSIYRKIDAWVVNQKIIDHYVDIHLGIATSYMIFIRPRQCGMTHLMKEVDRQIKSLKDV